VSDFENPQYRLASAIKSVSDRVKKLEAFDNAIFEIKTTTGRPAPRGNYHFVINTFDNTVEIYADGAWEDLIGAGGGGYTDEEAQDAVGNILTDTATIDFTYDDATPEITADVIPGGVDHDALLNFVGNEHIDHTSVILTAGDGLSGGGDISANRTFNVDMLGMEDLSAPAGDRILFYDDTAGKTAWSSAGNHLSFLGTDLNVEDDFVLNTGDSISGDLTFSGAFHPIMVPGSDTDAVLLEVTVTGTPQLIWDESEDSFSINKGLILTAGDIQIKSQNELRFYNNGNYIGFEAPALSADQIWVLPNEDGAAGEFLQTDGAGNLDWAAGGAGGGNCYIETGTYTGDGTVNQTINLSDSNLIIKHIIIWVGAADGTASNTFITSSLYCDDDADGLCVQTTQATGPTGRSGRIKSVGTGNFHVDDDGANRRPNTDGETYYYTVWGTH